MRLNSSEGQWIDLGVHFEACMVDPEVCGIAGGAVNVWLRVFGPTGGILSTITHQTGCRRNWDLVSSQQDRISPFVKISR